MLVKARDFESRCSEKLCNTTKQLESRGQPTHHTTVSMRTVAFELANVASTLPAPCRVPSRDPCSTTDPCSTPGPPTPAPLPAPLPAPPGRATKAVPAREAAMVGEAALRARAMPSSKPCDGVGAPWPVARHPTCSASRKPQVRAGGPGGRRTKQAHGRSQGRSLL